MAKTTRTLKKSDRALRKSVRSDVRGSRRKVKKKIGSATRKVRSRAGAIVSATKARAIRAKESTENVIRRNPKKSVALAAVLGAVGATAIRARRRKRAI